MCNTFLVQNKLQAFHFYTRNTRNAVKHADNQVFYFSAVVN